MAKKHKSDKKVSKKKQKKMQKRMSFLQNIKSVLFFGGLMMSLDNERAKLDAGQAKLEEAVSLLGPVLEEIRRQKAENAREKEENTRTKEMLEQRARSLEEQNIAHQNARQADLESRKAHHNVMMPTITKLVEDLRELAGLPKNNPT